MSVTTESPRLNGVDVRDPVRHPRRRQGPERDREVPVPGHQLLGRPARTAARRYSGFYGAMQEMQHEHETVVESDHPAVLVGQRRRTHAGRVPAARHRRLPHRRHRQHRRRSRRRADPRLLEGRGRHRPARHPRALRRVGAQRLRADRRHLPHRGRRRRRDPARDRRAVAAPLGRLRRPDQPHTRRPSTSSPAESRRQRGRPTRRAGRDPREDT